MHLKWQTDVCDLSATSLWSLVLFFPYCLTAADKIMRLWSRGRPNERNHSYKCNYWEPLSEDHRCWDSIDPDDDPHLLHNDASSWLRWTQQNKAGHDSFWGFHHSHTCICATLKTMRNGPFLEEHSKIVDFLCLHSGTPQDWDMLVPMTVTDRMWQGSQTKGVHIFQCNTAIYVYINDWKVNVPQGDCPTRSPCLCSDSADDRHQPDVGQVCLWWWRQFVQVHVII